MFVEKSQNTQSVHRLSSHTTRLSLIPGPRNIMDTMLFRRRRQIIDPLLALHTSCISLTDIPGAGSQVESIGGDEILALGRDPFGALAGRDVHDVHGVDFLETAAAGLAEKEVDDDGAEEVAGCEDVAVAVVDCAGDEGGEEGDEEVL